MAENAYPKIYGETGFKYGTADNNEDSIKIAGFSFWPTNITYGVEGEMKEIKGTQGAPVALVIAEQHTTAQMSGYMTNEGTMIASGEEITMPDGTPKVQGDQGTKWRVNSFSVEYSNEDVAKVSIGARTYRF